MADNSTVWVPVLPSFKDFSKGMESGTKGAGKSAGEQIAKELEAAVSKSEAAVSRAAQAAEKAQNKVADATGKVRVEQERYNKALESGDPVKIAQAEERLESALRRQSEATTDAERKSKDLDSAQKSLATAQDNVTKSAAEQERAVKGSALSAQEAEQATKDLESAQKILEVGLVAVGAAAIATAGYLVKLGADFQDMTKTIRVGTGASGEALEELRASAMNVGRDVPASFGEVGSALADINTALGLTGEPLEDLTTQFLNLETITGITADTSIPAVTRAFGDWGIATEDQGAILDRLFRASQATGSGVDTLAQRIVQFGAPMRGMGFDIDETTALLGLFEKTGVNTELVMGSMRQALSLFAREGKSAPEALRETINEIKNMEDPTNAASRAMEIFGARAGADMADTIRGGKFEIDELMASIAGGTDTINGVAEETRTFSDVMAIFKNNVLAELEPLATAAFGAILTGGEWLVEHVVPALQDMMKWMGENRSLMIALTIVVGSLVAGVAIARAGLVAYTIATRAMAVATLLSEKGVKGLNLAMRANIFGLIAGAVIGLVAGLAWLVKNTELGQRVWQGFMGVLGKAKDFFVDIINFGKMVTDILFGGDFSGAPFGLEEDSGVVNVLFTIRDTVLTVWEGIKTAFSVAWGFIQPIFTGFKIAFAIVLTAALLWWEGVKLYWTLVSNLVMWAWNSVIKPVFGLMQTGLQLLGSFFGWVWNSVIKPVWNALGAGIAWVWNAIIRPTWDLLKAALGLVGAAFQFYWNNVIKPVWNALGAGIKWVWENVIRPAWDALKVALGAVGDFFSWVWNAVIKPVWDALGAGIQWVADNVVHPVFDGLKRGLQLVGEGFEKAVDWISKVWDRIKSITAAPVKFVIDTVYNDGIRAVWNKVAGWLNLEELDPWRPQWLGDYASGGVLPGHTPGRDIYEFVEPRTGMRLGLGGGEGIMRPEFVDMVGGEKGINELNARARKGLPLGHAGHYAAGGVLPGWDMLTTDIQRAMAASVAQAFPNQRITSGTRYQDVGAGFDNHMQGRAVDFGLPGGPLASWIAREYGPSVLELFWDPGPNMVGGAPTGAIGGHSDHVHWAMANIIDPYTGDVISHGGQGGSGVSMVGSLVGKAFDSIINPIMDKIPNFGGGAFGEMPKALSKKMVDGLRSFLMSKIPGGGGSGDYGDWVGTPGVEQFRPLVEKLLREKGHDVGLAGSVLRRMNQESGGDPNAINLWDSNAAAGIPSKGLMQTIDPTFQAYKDPGYDNIWDPEANIRASMNYAMSRYGSLSAAYDRAGGYDNGGYLMPGTTLSVNETDKPEPVFTNSQWTLIKSLVISTAELLDPIRILAREGRDGIAHLEQIAADTRRSVQRRIDAVGAEVWETLPGEVKDALTVAEAVGQQWERVSGYLNDKAIAWSKGEWPIGSGRVPTDEPGPEWLAMHLDESLEKVARSNMDLVEQVIAGKVSPGRDPVANALFDIFGRDPILPDLAKIAALGPNAIEAATDAAMHAFETGETARLEEWTASNSQLTEAVLRARDAAILTGEMVQGAVNGYLNWAMASDSQGRQGSWQEYFQHYGGQYGTAQGDWLLSQVGLGGIIGGKFKDSFANLLIETAQSPLLSAPAILDDSGRVIGTQLTSETAAPTMTAAVEPELTELAPVPVVAVPDESIDLEAEPSAAGTKVTVEIPEGKTAITVDEFKEILVRIDERLDEVEIAIDGQADPAPLGLGVGGIV